MSVRPQQENTVLIWNYDIILQVSKNSVEERNLKPAVKGIPCHDAQPLSQMSCNLVSRGGGARSNRRKLNDNDKGQ